MWYPPGPGPKVLFKGSLCGEDPKPIFGAAFLSDKVLWYDPGPGISLCFLVSRRPFNEYLGSDFSLWEKDGL